MHSIRDAVMAVCILPTALLAQAVAGSAGASTVPKVGPPHGTVMVVGGGAIGTEIHARFIAAAGGPDALIIDVPNAGGADTYPPDGAGTREWRQAGARNVHLLFTKDRKLADSDSFVAILKTAGGVWFDGGRQFHLMEDYGGTKTEDAFNEVLARGGVVGGTSAGASILGDFLVRGAPSNDNFIMDFPGHEKGFAYLRGVGIDQHVVARERLPDLADSIMPKFPKLLGISEDEGTAWVVQGDTATIIGRDKAFVYGGRDPTDGRKPFLTLHPGDKYNLATRRVMHRAVDDSPVTPKFVNSLFAKYVNPSAGGATVLVAQNGEVFIDASFGIPDQARYMPTTTVPQFPLGGITAVFEALCSQLPELPGGGRGNPAAANAAAAGGARAGRGSVPAAPLTAFQRCITRRVATPIGLHKTSATADGDVQSDVDELYRLALGLEVPTTYMRDAPADANRERVDYAKGWEADTYRGIPRFSAFGVAGGKRDAFVRMPDRHAAIIILTNDETADARSMAGKIAERLVLSESGAKH
jgi:cyanophycinase